MTNWQQTDADRDLLERTIIPFLPDLIFDAHAHLFRLDHYAPGTQPAHLNGAPPQLGIAEYRAFMEWLHPGGRTVGGLFFGLVFNGDRDGNNRFVAEEVIEP